MVVGRPGGRSRHRNPPAGLVRRAVRSARSEPGRPGRRAGQRRHPIEQNGKRMPIVELEPPPADALPSKSADRVVWPAASASANSPTCSPAPRASSCARRGQCCSAGGRRGRRQRVMCRSASSRRASKCSRRFTTSTEGGAGSSYRATPADVVSGARARRDGDLSRVFRRWASGCRPARRRTSRSLRCGTIGIPTTP